MVRKARSVYARPLRDFIGAYVLGAGVFPRSVVLRTPIGDIDLFVHQREDMFTINEIFVHEIYKLPADPVRFLDLGGNIGVASSYFLSRSQASHGVAYEPIRQNVERFKENVAQFGARLSIIEAAVSDLSGYLEMNVEATGRYSGIDQQLGVRRSLRCESVDEAIALTRRTLGGIDVIKIDVEGSERAVVPCMAGSVIDGVSTVFVEGDGFDDRGLLAAGLHRTQPFADISGWGGMFRYDAVEK